MKPLLRAAGRPSGAGAADELRQRMNGLFDTGIANSVRNVRLGTEIGLDSADCCFASEVGTGLS